MKKKNRNKTKQNYTGKTNAVVRKSYSNFGSLSSKMTKTYMHRGVKNQTEFPEFIKLCKYTQKALKLILPRKLTDAGYTDVVVGDGYIYAKGTAPVLLTAHMDTVHKESVKDFYEYVDEKGNHIISSPQGIGGDDRAGIYMILEIVKDFKPSILFCEDEEIGGIGSSKFCKTELINELADLKYLIELDRANGNDAVFYDCDNPEFTKFIEDNTGYKEAYGSFSDISTLAPACGVAAVNLSCGYYHAHTLGEEVVVEEMLNTIEVVKKLLTVECKQFEYIEVQYGFGYGRGYNYYGYSNSYKSSSYKPALYGGGWYDDDYDDECTILYVTFYDGVTFKEQTKSYYGNTKDACWVKFFKDNPDTCYNYVVDFEWDFV